MMEVLHFHPLTLSKNGRPYKKGWLLMKGRGNRVTSSGLHWAGEIVLFVILEKKIIPLLLKISILYMTFKRVSPGEEKSLVGS